MDYVSYHITGEICHENECLEGSLGIGRNCKADLQCVSFTQRILSALIDRADDLRCFFLVPRTADQQLLERDLP